MHAPDGFLTPGTAVVTAAVSAGAIGVALRQARTRMRERQIPVAGMTAAFIFAAQMVNFPVVAGTSGHLLGAVLAVVLLGAPLGAVVMAVVVIVQALVFADGGLTALGYNLVNLAIVPTFGGWAVFRLVRRVLPATRSGVTAAVGLAAFVSIVFSAMAFSVEWLFGAGAPVPFDRVFAGVVTVHIFIGIGEAVISALVVGAVLAVRPDLVFGAQDLDGDSRVGRAGVRVRALVISGVLAALFVASVVSQFAVDSPDGLERVAADLGIEGNPAPGWLPAADYAIQGVNNQGLSLAIAGIAGTLIVAAVAWGLFIGTGHPRSGSPGKVKP